MKLSLLLFNLVGLFPFHSALGKTYLTNRCLCQLDNHLYTVRKNLEANHTYPATPTPGPTTAIPPTNPNNQEDSNATSSSTSSKTSTKEATTESTTAPANRRRKRGVETSDGSSSSSDESTEKGVLTPTVEGIVSYDSSVRLIKNDFGVRYNKSYNASLCDCNIGSTVALSFCLLNKKFNDSFQDPKSKIYRYHTDRLLPWIDNIFRNSYIKLLYVRTIPFGFRLFRTGQVIVDFNITLNERRSSIDYEIQTAFQTKEVKNGRFTINKELYETDVEYEKGCFKVRDTTPEEAEPEPSLGTIRYAFLGAAVGLCLIILVTICCAKWDKFFVRFW